jgi:hypothetical protein
MRLAPRLFLSCILLPVACTRGSGGAPAASASPSQASTPPPVATVSSVATIEDASAGGTGAPERPEVAAYAIVVAVTKDVTALRAAASPSGVRVCKHFVNENDPNGPPSCKTYTPRQLEDETALAAIREVSGTPESTMLAVCRLESPRRVTCRAGDSSRPGARLWTFSHEGGPPRVTELTHEWVGVR